MYKLIISLFISVIVVHGLLKRFDSSTLLLTILLTVLFYLMFSTNQGLPETTTPVPPHLGLDGISLENRL